MQPANSQLLYIYDIQAKNKRDFNRVKRVFYYRLKKLGLESDSFLSKSVLCVSCKLEKIMDNFFHEFKNSLTCHKVRAELIERL